MPKMTVLEIVTDILNDLEEDPVNSINDTVAAQEVAQILKTTYFNIVEGKDWPHLNELFQLDPSGLTARPNYMKLPQTISKIEWIKYNKRQATDTKDRYELVKYKKPDEFLNILDSRDSSDSTTITVVTDPSGVSLNVKKDTAPTYFTSFDDEFVVFDSYDADVDTTLQNTKTQCWGQRQPTFTVSDSFIPDFPGQMFSYLLAETKSVAFITLKQASNQKAEQQSISQRRRMSQDAWRIKRGITYAHMGRK